MVQSSSDTPMLVPVYEPTGRIVAMSQVPKNLPLLPILADILKGKAGRCFSNWKNLQVALEPSEFEIYSWEESKKGSNEEGIPYRATLR